jgi:hypothetical protein
MDWALLGTELETLLMMVGMLSHSVQTTVLVWVMVLVSVTGTVKVWEPELTTVEVTRWRVRDIPKVCGHMIYQDIPGQEVVTTVMVLVVGFTGVVVLW